MSAASATRLRGRFDAKNKAITETECFSLLMKGAVLCNDADVVQEGDKWVVKGDPTEGALVVATLKAGVQTEELRSAYPRINEFPFSSDRKRMTTIHSSQLQADSKKLIFMKGAPEIMLAILLTHLRRRPNSSNSLNKNSKQSSP